MYLLRRAWAELRDEVLALPSRTLVLAWVVALLALPAVYGDPYVMRILTMSCLFAIFAASWDLLAGYTGQVNFGHARFFGAGAYRSALVSLKLGVTPWASVFAGAAMATLCGFLAGYLCLRLRGSYLSLATLAFPLIALGLLFAFPDFSGGELGISGLRRLTPSATGNYYVAAVSMLLAVFVLYPLTEWLGSFRAFGELRLLIFAVIVLLVLLFMPRGLAPWLRDKIETQCPRCKQRNTFYRKICRLCGAALQAQVPGAQRLVGHQ